jgi:hypothetical protein
MWRRLRIALLLLILATALLSAGLDRFQAASWNDTLTVGIFPIDADGRPATRAYLAGLDSGDFRMIEQFFARESARHGLQRRDPLQIRLHPAVTELPPRLVPGSSAPARLWWSLKMRWYARRHGQGKAGQVRVFVLYHDPAVTPRVPHSLGLQKGLIGVVYAYATDVATAPNNLVIAHEVLHTLGATDKYDTRTLQPRFPDGYAEPQAEPRHPQRLAEIMAGRRALSETTAEMPDTLEDARVGLQTAREISWIAGNP